MNQTVRNFLGWKKYCVMFGHVEGWLHPFTARMMLWLGRYQSTCKIHGGIGEIGVHHGKSFLPLYFALVNKEIAIAIDVFDNQEFNFDHSGRGDRKAFLKNVLRYGGDVTRVNIIQKNSLDVEADEIIRFGGLLRMMSIDGSHTEKVTCSDLVLSEQSLCEEGLIFLDDVYNERFPEVIGGLGRYLWSGGNYRPFAVVPGKLILCRNTHVDLYVEYFHGRLGSWVDYEKNVFGYPCIGLGLNGNYLRRSIAITRTGKAVKRALGRGRY